MQVQKYRFNCKTLEWIDVPPRFQPKGAPIQIEWIPPRIEIPRYPDDTETFIWMEAINRTVGERLGWTLDYSEILTDAAERVRKFPAFRALVLDRVRFVSDDSGCDDSEDFQQGGSP